MEVMEQIEQALAQRVRPALAGHGGDIRVESFADGVLRVRLLGQCAGCMSASDTVQELVAAEVTAAVPQVLRVEPVAGVSEDLLDQARALLRARRQP